MIFIVSGVSILGTLLTFEYKHVVVDSEKALIKSEEETPIQEIAKEEEEANPYDNSLKKAIFSKQFIVLFIFAMLSICN